MHTDAVDFMIFVKSQFPEFFKNVKVLDVGSGDINGNNRFLFENSVYYGNDVCEGKNVTIVSKTKDLPFHDNLFDTIVSTECFEHDPEYKSSWKKIYAMLNVGGLFCFTCASDGRKEHGTLRTSPTESFGTIANIAGWTDYYQNLNLSHLSEVFDLQANFSQYACYYNSTSKDLYFWGIKSGSAKIYTTYDYSNINIHKLTN
jgi:hypothetical protein